MIVLRLILTSFATVAAVHVCNHEENLALQGDVSQSGTIRSATLAVDGDVRPAQTEDDKPQCALTKSGVDMFSWWQVNLQETFLVSNVEIYTPDANITIGVGFEKLQDSEIILVTPGDISLCQTGTHDEETGKIVAFCGLSGQFLTIINQAVYKPLSMCEVQIYGHNRTRTNLALGKDTQQSSDVYNAVSSLAVDGKISSLFYSYDNGQMIPVCTHTSEEIDRHPWWRVDLGDLFLIKSLNIYNRGEGLHARLHDIEIRVGNTDIATFTDTIKLPEEVVGDVLFTHNLLCASIEEDSLNAGSNEIMCTQPTLGRYVSIQIIKLCDSYACRISRANVKNMLSLCEVEVFGQKMDLHVDDGSNLSFGNVMTLSTEGEEYDVDDEYSWVNIDLQETDIIFSLDIELDTDQPIMALLEIRIGNEPISSEYNNKHFTQNQLCNSRREISKHSAIFCKSPVMGRYITLQLKQCYGDNCMEKELIMHSLCDIKIWGVPRTTYKPSLNVAPFKSTTQSSVQDSGNPSLAVDRIIPDMNSDVDKCALTSPKNYPWWRVDLKAPHRIKFVIMHLPSSNNISVDSEFEVRVGDEDISDQVDESMFNENNVCQIEKTDSTETKFRCNSSHSGRYVSIQLNSKNLTTESLQLCEVEVIGCEI